MSCQGDQLPIKMSTHPQRDSRVSRDLKQLPSPCRYGYLKPVIRLANCHNLLIKERYGRNLLNIDGPLQLEVVIPEAQHAVSPTAYDSHCLLLAVNAHDGPLVSLHGLGAPASSPLQQLPLKSANRHGVLEHPNRQDGLQWAVLGIPYSLDILDEVVVEREEIHLPHARDDDCLIAFVELDVEYLLDGALGARN